MDDPVVDSFPQDQDNDSKTIMVGSGVSDEIIELSQSLNKGKSSQIHIPDKSIQHDPNYNKKYSNEYYKLVLTKEEIELIDAFVAEERFELPTFGL